MRGVLGKLRSALAEIIPQRDRELVRMLRAARHVQRFPATDTKRGRPSKWRRDDLLKVAIRLGHILDRETSSRTSVASFIDHYLRLLHFPADVTKVLAEGEINLFEAEQLARVTEKRLGVEPPQAKRTRDDLLGSHLQTKASGEHLRRRVNELLGNSTVEDQASPEINALAQSFGDLEDLEDFDPYDPTHLFWDQLKQLGFAFREIGRGDVTDEEIEELLKASEPVMAIVAKIQRRKGQMQVSKLKL